MDRVGSSYVFDLPPAGRLAPTPAELLDVEACIDRLDSGGISAAVLSPWLELVGYELPVDEGAAWARFLNEQMLDELGEQPRLVPMATVPLQDGELAAKEVEWAREMGFAGIEIGTRGGEHELDDDALSPFWEAVAECGMPVLLHPMLQGEDERFFPYQLANSVGRIVDTTIALSRLLFSGVLVRLPSLKVIVAHGGASIPYILGRLQLSYSLASDEMADPRQGFDRLFFDTVLFDSIALRYLLEVAGTKHVLLGSDHPFPNRDPDPRRFVVETIEEEKDMRAVLGSNAAELFKVKG